ncbi:MAG TPA: T9SS type A sorting domain-containing protein, partial [Saprospiraceae bacterium]
VISGTIFRDFNQNTIYDSGDTPLALHRVLLLPDSTIAFSNYAGKFTFSVPPGDYEVKYIPQVNWHIDNSPGSYQISVSSTPVTDLDFNIAPLQEIRDMRVFINEGFPRCNRDARYWMSWGNKGTNMESGEIKFVLDSLSTFVRSYPPPSFTSGDTITWAFHDLLPFSTSVIDMDLHIPGPVENDSTVLFKALLSVLENSTFDLVDSAVTEQWLFCAFDPNDKIARSRSIRADGTSHPDDPIQYTIRFQNTGNDTAFNVVIRDTLDVNLDLNSFEVISASHPFETSLKTDGALEFRFINILLADSIVNEPASHGFVSYSIQAKKDLPTPLFITNTAHIYFDFNAGIRTNATLNELTPFIVHTDNVDKAIMKGVLKAYPNPASDEIYLELDEDVDEHLVNYYILDVFGRIVIDGVIEKRRPLSVPMGGVAEGIYFIHTVGANHHRAITMVRGKND